MVVLPVQMVAKNVPVPMYAQNVQHTTNLLEPHVLLIVVMDMRSLLLKIVMMVTFYQEMVVLVVKWIMDGHVQVFNHLSVKEWLWALFVEMEKLTLMKNVMMEIQWVQMVVQQHARNKMIMIVQANHQTA